VGKRGGDDKGGDIAVGAVNPPTQRNSQETKPDDERSGMKHAKHHPYANTLPFSTVSGHKVCRGTLKFTGE